MALTRSAFPAQITKQRMPVNFHIQPDYSGSVVRPVNRQRDNAKRSDENLKESGRSIGWWTVAALASAAVFPHFPSAPPCLMSPPPILIARNS